MYCSQISRHIVNVLYSFCSTGVYDLCIDLTRYAILAKPLRKQVRLSVFRDTNISAIPPVITATAFSRNPVYNGGSRSSSSGGSVKKGRENSREPLVSDVCGLSWH